MINCIIYYKLYPTFDERCSVAIESQSRQILRLYFQVCKSLSMKANKIALSW